MIACDVSPVAMFFSLGAQVFKEEEEEENEQVKKKEGENQERGRVMVVDTRYVLAVLNLSILTITSRTSHYPNCKIQGLIVSHRQRGLGGALLCPGQQVSSYTPKPTSAHASTPTGTPTAAHTSMYVYSY